MWFAKGLLVFGVVIRQCVAYDIGPSMKRRFNQYDPNVNLFAIMDVDDSQTITSLEFRKFFQLENKQPPDGFWESEDKNGDGVISFDEFGGPKVQQQTREPVAISSHKQNQAVATRTGRTPIMPFDALDSNRDGVISEDEFSAYFHYSFSNGVTTQKHPSNEAFLLSGIAELYHAHDLNQDSVISRSEYTSFWNSL